MKDNLVMVFGMMAFFLLILWQKRKALHFRTTELQNLFFGIEIFVICCFEL